MNNTSTSVLDVKFATIKAVAFSPRPAPLAAALDALTKRLGPTPGVYSAEPAVLDFTGWTAQELRENDISLDAFAALFSKAKVNLVEIRGQDSLLEEQAESLGLRYETGPAQQANTQPEQSHTEIAPKPETVVAATPINESKTTVEETTPAETKRRTMVIDQSVRSGQRIYAQGADLIVMGQVSAGAEVIADGNVHVYGVLRGRALAGASGDTDARIMSTCFEAELVAVAGYYLTFEGGFPEENRSKPTFIYLDQGVEPVAVRLKAINIR